MRSFIRRSAVTLSLGVSASLALASSVMAYSNDAGEEAGPGMSVMETVMWFVVAPALISAVIWFLWSIPAWRRSSAPATGDNWNPKPSADVVQR